MEQKRKETKGKKKKKKKKKDARTKAGEYSYLIDDILGLG